MSIHSDRLAAVGSEPDMKKWIHPMCQPQPSRLSHQYPELPVRELVDMQTGRASIET